MFPRELTDTRAYDIATAMLDGFNTHYRLFRGTSSLAKQRFERGDWHGQQRAQALRIEFYDKRVEEAALAIAPRLEHEPQRLFWSRSVTVFTVTPKAPAWRSKMRMSWV